MSSAASALDNKVLRAAIEYAEAAAAAAPISHRLFSRSAWKDTLLGIWESRVSREIKKKKKRQLQNKTKEKENGYSSVTQQRDAAIITEGGQVTTGKEKC